MGVILVDRVIGMNYRTADCRRDFFRHDKRYEFSLRVYDIWLPVYQLFQIALTYAQCYSCSAVYFVHADRTYSVYVFVIGTVYIFRWTEYFHFVSDSAE